MLHIVRSKLCSPSHTRLRLNPSLLSATVRYCFTPPQPSNKTLIVLDGLPLSVTNSILKQALSGIDSIRKSEVQPGCSLHIVDEAGAKYAADKITQQLTYPTRIKNTCLPTIILNNVPVNVNANLVDEAFKKYAPKAVRFSGKRSVLVTVADASQAIDILQLVRSISIDGRQLDGHVSNTPEGRHCIQVTDFSLKADLSVVLNTIAKSISADFPTATLSASSGTSSVKVRVNTRKHSPTSIEETLKRVTFGKHSPLSTEVKQVPRPCVVIRNVSQVSEDGLRSFCVDELRAERVQRTWRSKDMFGDLAFAYFSTEADAFEAIQRLRASDFGGNRVKASYREMAEPAVKISGLAASTTTLQLLEIFEQFRIHRAEVIPVTEESDLSTREAIIVVSDHKEAARLTEAVNLRKFGGVQYQAQLHDVADTSVEFVFSENELPGEETLAEVLRAAGLSHRSVVTSTNVSAFVTFGTLDDATRSLGALQNGEIKLLTENSVRVKTAYEGGGPGTLVSKLSVYPSYVVEVRGVSSEDSAENVFALATEDNRVNVFKAERSATAKFKRHLNVVPGMKALRAVEVEGFKLRPRRFHKLEEEGDSEYDVQPEELKEFDKNHLTLMLKDYLTSEPAIRYQIARNYFERALYTAQGRRDISYILDEGSPNHIQAEVKQLISEKNNLDGATEPFDNAPEKIPKELKARVDKTVGRLFELFIQREDMSQFSRGFDELEATLGPGSDDAFDWNNFMCNDEEALKKLQQDPRYYQGDKSDRKDAAFAKKIADKKKARRDRRDGVVVSDEDEAKAEAEAKAKADNKEGTEETKKVEGTVANKANDKASKLTKEEDLDFKHGMKEKNSYEADMLMDHDGHLWSGIIVHQDTTQNVTPQERVLSYRCLVVIGNRRGAGGFGMGKGSDADVALRNAFRDALKNLIFIDLYENAALAHDLKGKHNDCIIYIRATPKAREMVASPLATSIFNGFGIVSCSAKIVGKRHPYATVRAIFNALSKHKNLDEIAKERGARYLTLKWMYDNGL